MAPMPASPQWQLVLHKLMCHLNATGLIEHSLPLVFYAVVFPQENGVPSMTPFSLHVKWRKITLCCTCGDWYWSWTRWCKPKVTPWEQKELLQTLACESGVKLQPLASKLYFLPNEKQYIKCTSAAKSAEPFRRSEKFIIIYYWCL